MNARFLVALTSVAALCACNSEGNSARNGSGGDRSGTVNAASTSRNASAPAAGATAGVEQQIAAAAARGQSQVPLEMGGATITAVQANGTELITSLTLPVDLNQQMADQIAQPLSAQQCSDPNMAELMRRGGRLTWKLKDSQGEEFSIRTAAC